MTDPNPLLTEEPPRSERRRFMRRELWIAVVLVVGLLIWLVIPKSRVATEGGLVVGNSTSGATAIAPAGTVPVSPAKPAGVP